MIPPFDQMEKSGLIRDETDALVLGGLFLAAATCGVAWLALTVAATMLAKTIGS